MLQKDKKIAVYMDKSLDSDYGKMGFGVMRYIQNPIACVIDTTFAGKKVNEVTELPFDYPVVSSIAQALELGAQVLVLGTAPSGGRVPEEWNESLSQAIEHGMSIVNGLHDKLNDQFGHSLKEGQWIWDIRQPAFTPQIASAKADGLNNKRVLLVGTDMAIGKMTAGLEIFSWVKEQGINTSFLATGQIGITITGQGIPLDAFKVDHACGAVETMVMDSAKSDVIFIEGQGSLLHPGSSATLSLMRGSCATHLIMCHKAQMDYLRKPEHVKVPPISEFIALNEALATACGSLTKAKTIGIALNTSTLSEAEAIREISELEQETGLPVQDVVRFDAGKLGKELIV
ncbi:MAG: DUF1611 domain-containing protein [Gammaproteobacteria bacterium]|nr:DUF1611 domain-containing protein [Gammaproteobacteria bacterium]